MTIVLAIETSCDETAAAVTRGIEILSSVKWTQEVHAKFGGVVPALAKRAHEERIDSIVNAALRQAQCGSADISAIAVTMGPGLAIALEVGIKKAKELAREWNKPLVAVNHIEGHLLSALAEPISNSQFTISKKISFPALALVVSGGHTQIIKVKKAGDYEILVESADDDIGEALDKGARMLGLPYPGGPALEKAAAGGNPKAYKLPLPMAGREGRAFSYSGLKAAFYRLVTQMHSYPVAQFAQEEICDLAASYQEMVFKHLIRTLRVKVQDAEFKVQDLLVGGGVAANMKLREEIGKLSDQEKMSVHYPMNLLLCTDNAAMIGVAAGFKADRGEFCDPESVDRKPRWRVDD